MFHVGHKDLFECHVLNRMHMRARSLKSIREGRNESVRNRDREASAALDSNDSGQRGYFDAGGYFQPQSAPAIHIRFLVHGVDDVAPVNESDPVRYLLDVLRVVGRKQYAAVLV